MNLMSDQLSGEHYLELLGHIINYNLLDCEPRISAFLGLPFLKYVSVFCDTVLEKRGSRHKICQLMTRPNKELPIAQNPCL